MRRRLVLATVVLIAGCAQNPSVPIAGGADAVARAGASSDLCPVPSVTIYFEPWSAELTPAARDLLDGLREQGPDCEVAGLDVYAYGDTEGSEAENARLTLARAEAVRDQLVAYGASGEIIRLVPRGQEGAVAPDGTPVPQYRRAVIVVRAEG